MEHVGVEYQLYNTHLVENIFVLKLITKVSYNSLFDN